MFFSLFQVHIYFISKDLVSIRLFFSNFLYYWCSKYWFYQLRKIWAIFPHFEELKKPITFLFFKIIQFCLLLSFYFFKENLLMPKRNISNVFEVPTIIRYVGLWIESKTKGQIRRHKQTYRMRKRDTHRECYRKSLSYKLALKFKCTIK